MLRIKLLLTVAVLSLGWVKADVPVHCKCQMVLFLFIGRQYEILGQWKFMLTKVPFKVDIFEIDSLCTHKLPNR